MPNLNKYKAYKHIAENYGSAIDILMSQNLVLGEGAVVPYYKDSISKDVKLLLGIGSLNGNVEIFGGITSDTSNGYVSIIYYGSGTDTIAVMQNSTESTTPFMSYSIETVEDGSFVYLAVPSTMPSLRFELDNVISPTTQTETSINGVPYVIYSTVETVSAGHHLLRVFNTVVENSVVLTANPSLIRVGNETVVTLIARCTTSADNIVIYDSSNNQLGNGSGTFLELATTLAPTTTMSTTFIANATFGGDTIRSKVTVTSYLVFYYGSGTSYTDATIEVEKETPYGTYTVNIENDGDKIFFVIPRDLSDINITMNGFSVPVDNENVEIDGYRYTVYESTNRYRSGSYEIMIMSPSSGQPQPSEGKIYYGSGETYLDATSVYESDTPQGVYNIGVQSDGEYIFFLFPVSMQDISDITMNGYSVPKSERIVQMNGSAYVSYQSTNRYRTGLYKLIVS